MQQRREFARRIIPFDGLGGAENSRALVLRVLAAEIAHQPGANAFGLSDVQHLALAREHSIDTGPVGSGVSNVRSHYRELCVARRLLLDPRRAPNHALS